jgi:hypothetical protein
MRDKDKWLTQIVIHVRVAKLRFIGRNRTVSEKSINESENNLSLQPIDKHFSKDNTLPIQTRSSVA